MDLSSWAAEGSRTQQANRDWCHRSTYCILNTNFQWSWAVATPGSYRVLPGHPHKILGSCLQDGMLVLCENCWLKELGSAEHQLSGFSPISSFFHYLQVGMDKKAGSWPAAGSCRSSGDKVTISLPSPHQPVSPRTKKSNRSGKEDEQIFLSFM